MGYIRKLHVINLSNAENWPKSMGIDPETKELYINGKIFGTCVGRITNAVIGLKAGGGVFKIILPTNTTAL